MTNNLFRICLFILLSFPSISVFSNTPNIDSLENVLKQHSEIDSNLVKLLNEMSNEYFRYNLSKTYQYANNADSIANLINYQSGRAESLRLIGRYHWRTSNYTKAHEYLENAYQLFDELGDELGKSKCYNNFGNIYHSQSDFIKALEYYQKSLEIDERLNNKVGLAIGYNNIGIIYRDLADYEMSLEYSLKALETRLEINDKAGLSMSYNNIGILYQSQGDYSRALDYYHKSLTIKEELGDKNGLSATYNNIGVIFRIQGELQKALDYYQKALDIRIETGDKNGISSCYNNMAIIYRTQGDIEKAMEFHFKALEMRMEIGDKSGISMSYSNIALLYRDFGNFDKAYDYYRKGLQLSLEIGSISNEGWLRVGLAQLDYQQKRYSEAYKNSKIAYRLANQTREIELINVSSDILAKSSAAMGFFEDAYKYHVMYKNISDSIQNEANTKKIIGLEYEYKYQKELELTKLEQEKNEAVFREELLRQKNIRNSFFVGFVLVLLLLAFLFYGFLQRKKRNRLLAIQKSFEFKQNFLANMSHEIRTPLTGLVGMIDIMKKTKLDDDQSDYVKTLEQSSNNLQVIINHILDYSNIEAGRFKLRSNNFHFQSIFINAKSLFDNICDKEIDFEINSDPDIPETIKADYPRLMQVINNLISNAVKFTNKGSIVLTSKLLNLNTDTNEVFIKIEISDTGKGIGKDKQKHLFVPFSQIDQNDKRNFDGAGLGLSICKEIVVKHGGEIGYNTEVNKGSTFWFTFKAFAVNKQEQSSSESFDDIFNIGKSLNVMFVEDKATTQKVVKLILNSMGHNVILADNGAHALELFQPGLFDLILMDIQMPVMDGITATQMLKEKYNDVPPIVGLSANAFEGAREKYMKQGMDEYITKPLVNEDFVKVVKKLL
jgi:two-component system, OmpR family, aerobic respiration control sensor histidine kinase ArcB